METDPRFECRYVNEAEIARRFPLFDDDVVSFIAERVRENLAEVRMKKNISLGQAGEPTISKPCGPSLTRGS
ncbi:MAG: hypothetical protein ACO35C_07655 [Pontimonas sp.]